MFLFRFVFIEVTQNFLLSGLFKQADEAIRGEGDKLIMWQAWMQSPVTSSEMKMGKKLGKLTEFDIKDDDRDGEVCTVYFVASNKGKPSLIFSFFLFSNGTKWTFVFPKIPKVWKGKNDY